MFADVHRGREIRLLPYTFRFWPTPQEIVVAVLHKLLVETG